MNLKRALTWPAHRQAAVQDSSELPGADGPVTLPEHRVVTIDAATCRKSTDAKHATLKRISATQQGWLTAYKLLFILSVSVNLVTLVLTIATKPQSGFFKYAQSHAALFSIANILALVLCRSEVLLRGLFFLAVLLFRHAPLRLKLTITTILHNVGGIHGGCGVSSVLWLSYGVSQAYKNAARNNPTSGAAVAMLALLLLSSAAAIPALRHLHHNAFERIHRFAGWTALGLVWYYVAASYSSSRKQLITAPELWGTTAVTILIIIPWLGVRKVAVRTTVPSPYVSLIEFGGPGVRPGLLARISRSPMSEWHAFGTVSDGRDVHVIVAGVVGDFTTGLAERPPSHVWVRSSYFAGIPYLTNMYERVLHVATGSGICVFLSFLLQEDTTRADVHVIWIAKRVSETYGKEFEELLKRCNPAKLTVYDTAVSIGGRPNVGELAVAAVRQHDIQVVIVTSNPSGTKGVLDSCEANGIPAFGPTWDS